MAFCDYHACDCCGERKTFYDAHMNQEFIGGAWRIDYAPGGNGYGPFPGYRIVSLCHECEKTHVIKIIARTPLTEEPKFRQARV